MYAIIAQSIRDLSTSSRLKVNCLYNERVYRYIGTDSIGLLIKRFAAKKPE